MTGQVLIKTVTTKSDRKRFVNLAWDLYKDDPYWIAPLKMDMHNTLNPEKNALLKLGPHKFLLAYLDGKATGRIGVGLDLRLNAAKDRSIAYFTLYESINNYNVTKALFDYSIFWLKKQGAEILTGPQSPSNGDDYRGMLISGFDSSPVILNSYNPPFYNDFLKRYGFEKQFDRNAYYFDISNGPSERLTRGVKIAEKRYDFKVRALNMDNLERDISIIKKVVEAAMPEWPDMIPPSDEELLAEVEKLRQLAVPDLVLFAENNKGECLGFSVTLPDYNQVLRHLNGRLFPFGFIKYMWHKRKIIGVRMFALFVTSGGRRRGVSAALYYYTMVNANKLGYQYGEGSTIHEFNSRMNIDARKAGGKLDKVYRVYQINI